MDPVMRALQSIADIQSETRELRQLEPASTCRTARLLSQNWGGDSPVPAEGRNEPAMTYATSEGTANLHRISRAPEIADVESDVSEAARAWDEEIKIDRCDRIVIAPARDVTPHAVRLIVGVPLSVLALWVVWLGGSDSHFAIEPASLPETASNLQQTEIVQNRTYRQLHRRTRLLHHSVVCAALQNEAFNT